MTDISKSAREIAAKIKMSVSIGFREPTFARLMYHINWEF